MSKSQVNIKSLYSKSMFLNRGSVDLYGSTSYALLSASSINFKAWVSNLQPASLVRATDTFVNCLHAKKFHNKLNKFYLLFFFSMSTPRTNLTVTGVALSNARTQRFVSSNLSFSVIKKIIIFVMHIYVD